MNMMFSTMAALFLFAAGAQAETFFLVKFTTHTKEDGYKLLNQEEYTKYSQYLRSEAAMFSIAQRAAEKTWKEENPEDSWTGRSVKPRTMRMMKRLMNEEAANKELAKYEERLYRSSEPKSASKNKGDRRDRGSREDEKRNKEMREKREARDEERLAKLEAAVPYIVAEIQALIKKQPNMKEVEYPEF